MVKIKYNSPSIDNQRKIRFSKFELKKSEDLRVIWSAFQCYAIKGPIKMNVKVARSTDDILKTMKRRGSSINY